MTSFGPAAAAPLAPSRDMEQRPSNTAPSSMINEGVSTSAKTLPLEEMWTLFGCLHRAANGTRNHDLADSQVAFDLAAIADDEISFGNHGAVEFPIDPERGLEAQLAVDMTAAVEKAVEVARLAFGLEDHRMSPRSISRS